MHKRIDFGVRPICITPGCGKERQVYNRRKDGSPIYRHLCQYCHLMKLAEKHGMQNLTQFKNSIHPYRKHRKTYCENIDGRLGYKCTTTIMIEAQLDVDHIDGNPANNDPDNLQTLCQCCHKYKTLVNEDYKTPGRRELGITY